jgi:hypothetical protein
VLNVLAIAAQAYSEMGLPAPSQVAGGNTADGPQILALLNREGKELARKPWPELRGEQLITLVPGQQAYPFPTDISWYRPGTSWDRTTHWRTVGPLSDREWQAIRSGIAVAAPFVRWRLYGGQLQIDPVPTVTDQIAFEYISNNWCTSSGGTPQSSFLADTDVPLLPDDLFVLGLKWRVLAAKGFNYSEEKDAYLRAVDERFAGETASDILDLGRRIPRISNFGFPVIPDGNWPGR